MEAVQQNSIRERYLAAVNSFIERIKTDPNVIAVIVSGSLAYDVVWEKSDVDMTVIVRDQSLKNESYCIIEDGITINVYLIIRSAFKRGMERELAGSSLQSYFSKGKIMYTTDDSLHEYFEDLKMMGRDDIALTVFYIASELVYLRDKCQKWLTARRDPIYAQYFLLKAAEALARMELCLHQEPLSRESIQRALQYNPELIAPFYQDAMSHHMSEEEIVQRIDQIDGYLEQHMDLLMKPVIEFMSDQEIKTTTLISKHFHTEGHFIVEIFEYLVEKGALEKVSQTIRLTPKSRKAVEELGYLYIS